jgi:pSer/pThr/pTyr-binding forkhead associated (FHA) protein
MTGTLSGFVVGATPSGPLPAVGSGVMSGIPAGSAVLIVQRGPGEGTTYPLEGQVVTAGRAPEATLFLDDITVSRAHAEFHRDGAGWTVRDSGSLNGTYVNRHRVDVHRLQPGDEVQIGKYRFVYLVAEGAEVPEGTS